ncbi:MAG: DUF3472 domain-containing protein [Planctomycetota bacterium]
MRGRVQCKFVSVASCAVWMAVLGSSFFVDGLPAGENAAPSSHMVFDDNFEGDILINEVRVPKDGEALYTYYETLGWRGGAAGYAGIQAHPKAHNYIFSIWDHKKHSAPIRSVYRGPGTRTETFGGEGTGLKSWNFTLGWQTGTWYTLVSRCWPVGDHTFYAFWARSGKTKQWTHLVTMDVAAEKAFFQGGTDAFIEDWLETGVNSRTSNLRGGWKRKLGGDWHPFQDVRYSVNYWDLEKGKRSFNFRTSWNGGVLKDETGPFFFMTAGGKKTRPTTKNPSTHRIARKEKKPKYEPIVVESLRGRSADSSVAIEWKIKATALPLFSYEVSLHSDRDAKTEPLTKLERRVVPHERKAELKIPAAANGPLFLKFQARDSLDNDSTTRIVAVERN